MARGRKAKSDKPSLSSTLVVALKFISVAQKDEGELHETHCVMRNNFIVAFNGTIAAGHKIAEDMNACPHTIKLIAALEKCGDSLSITQLDNERLSIKSDKFKAFVNCTNAAYLPEATPDAPIAVINDKLKDGFEKISCLVSDNSEHVLTASILLRSGSMVSTNRHAMLEYWHGISLPPDLCIPKVAAMAIAKCAKPLASLGFSECSVTFWFDDGSWIKTQQYVEKWPNVDKILNQASLPVAPPEGFFMALDAILKFSEDNFVYFREGLLATHRDESLGASYEIESLKAGPIFSGKSLKLCEPFVKTIDFNAGNGIAYFFGDDIRGCIAGKV